MRLIDPADNAFPFADVSDGLTKMEHFTLSIYCAIVSADINGNHVNHANEAKERAISLFNVLNQQP